MKKPITISILILLGLSIFVPSCKKDTPTPVVTTVTLSATKDAAIFNGTNAYNASGVNGQYNDYGSGGSDLLRVGYSDNNYFLMRTLVAFNVATIPADAKIISATLSFTLAKSGNNAPAVNVHKLTQDWTEGTTRESAGDNCTYNNTYCSTPGILITSGDVSWSHANYNTTTWTTAGGTFVSTASATVSNGGSPVFSSQGLIDDVKAWIATPASNFGWLLKVDEAALAGGGGEQIRYIGKEAAANGATADTKPKLTIVYQK